MELLDRPAEANHGQAIVGGSRRPPTTLVGPHGCREGADVQAAPVGVVHRHARRALVILLGPDGPRQQRVAAVGADDHARTVGHRAACWRPATNAGNPPGVVDQHRLDREALAHLHARLDRSVDQQLVEHGAARAIRDRNPIDRLRRPGDHHRTEVKRVLLDRRAIRRNQPIQQTPPLQCGYARWMHDMGGHRVASERRLVHEQHAMPAAREQHRRRSTGAASADHDHVITVGHW